MPDARKSSQPLSPDLAASMIEGNAICVLIFDAAKNLFLSNRKARALLPDAHKGDNALATAQIAAINHGAPSDFHVGDRGCARYRSPLPMVAQSSF